MYFNPQIAQRLKAAALTAALLFVASAQAQDNKLSPADIQSQWVGKTVFVKVANGALAGRTLSLQLKANGTGQLGEAFQDTGVWRLSETGYCATWTRIRGGQEGCLTVVVKGGQTQVLNADGSLNSTVTEVR